MHSGLESDDVTNNYSKMCVANYDKNKIVLCFKDAIVCIHKYFGTRAICLLATHETNLTLQ